MYRVYICGAQLPEEPSSISIKTGSKNKTSDLLDGKTISFLRSPGLKEVTLTFSLPMVGARRTAEYYIALYEKFKTKKKPTQLIVTRSTQDGKPLEDTNLKMSINDMTVSEDASKPLEKQVTLALREYVDYGTQTVTVKEVTENGKTQKIAKVEKDRETEKAPKATTYTVKSGDTLWSIAAKYLGSGARYKDIFEANKDKLSDPNLIKDGTVLKIPQ